MKLDGTIHANLESAISSAKRLVVIPYIQTRSSIGSNSSAKRAAPA